MKDWKRRCISFFSSYSRGKFWWNFFHRRRKKSNNWWSRGGKIFGIIFVLYVLFVFWPLKGLLGHGFFTGSTLILFTNEAEQRPCGGFLTTYAVIDFFPPDIRFHNSYDLAGYDFGEAENPLKKISQKKNFWDLGTTSNLTKCTNTFQKSYQEATGEMIDRVVLFDMGTVEEIFRLFKTIKLGKQTISENNFFAELSRLVSHIDRHDEIALKQRKSPLSQIGKKMIFRSIVNPTIAPRAARIISNRIRTGDVFIPQISPDIQPEKTDFALTEWNLGGAKSSRFLDTALFLFFRETNPDVWNITLRVDVVHSGGIDEPISQNWKGGFELIVPKFLGVEPIFWETEILPGETFSRKFFFSHQGSIEKFSVFRPRGQNISLHTIISLFPQQTFDHATFEHHENVGRFWGMIDAPRKTFHWTSESDRISPFVTLHEIVSPDILPEMIRDKWNTFLQDSDSIFSVAEIHFNEKIRLNDSFSVKIKDRNLTHTEVSEDMILEDFILLKDNRTLLLILRKDTFQLGERFALELTGISDFFGNEIQPQSRTLITR
jgi:hypothetical protein